MLKRIVLRKRNLWVMSAVVALVTVRLFEPFKSSALLTTLAALAIAVVTVVLAAIIPKSSQ